MSDLKLENERLKNEKVSKLLLSVYTQGNWRTQLKG